MADGTKKLLNSPNCCVDECLAGLTATNPRLVLFPARRVVVDNDAPGKRRVGVVSGGGSGHEPFPAGYVGAGMLTAAVCGSVFAAPPSDNILFAIRATARRSPAGVLVLIPNYTGDILNFGLAIELAKSEGLKVDSLIVGDDIAQCSRGDDSQVGRRGMVGIVAVFKMAGHAAENGASLEEVRAATEAVLEDTASMGVAVGGGTLPGASAPLFTLAPDEMELGVGVHGEAGIRRLKLEPAKQIVALCLEHLSQFLCLESDSKVVALINNLGGLSQLEQWVLAGEVQQQLADHGVSPLRTYAAPLFTSVDMPGFQICLIRVPAHREEDYLAALDADTVAPAWPGRQASIPPPPASAEPVQEPDLIIHFPDRGPQASPELAAAIGTSLLAVTGALRRNEERLNILDSGCGDGDCGTTLRHLADGIDEKTVSGRLQLRFPATACAQLAAVAASTMGGTSGAIYSLLFTHAGETLANCVDLTTADTWCSVWRSGIQGVQKYSRARVGDRTMFDSLEPALRVFEDHIENGYTGKQALEEAVVAAKEGCDRTKTMTARAGRASYVDAARITEEDAGAFAVTVWLQAVLDALHS